MSAGTLDQTRDLPQPDDLTGQVAWVTGAGRGIGRAIAQALAGAGARVALTSRSADQLAETVSLIERAGGHALSCAADVTDRQAIERAATEAERQLGPIDLLVNNAGSCSVIGPIWEVDPDRWWRDVEVNFKGTFLCSRAVLPGMLARGRGHIVNVAGSVGLGPAPYAANYACAKAAVLRLTDSVAASIKMHGIGVFAISPGWVHTAISDYLQESAEGQAWIPEVRDLPPERWLPPERVAQLVLFLASGRADALTGRYVHVSYDVQALVDKADQIRKDDLYVIRLRQ